MIFLHADFEGTECSFNFVHFEKSSSLLMKMFGCYVGGSHFSFQQLVGQCFTHRVLLNCWSRGHVWGVQWGGSRCGVVQWWGHCCTGWWWVTRWWKTVVTFLINKDVIFPSCQWCLLMYILDFWGLAPSPKFFSPDWRRSITNKNYLWIFRGFHFPPAKIGNTRKHANDVKPRNLNQKQQISGVFWIIQRILIFFYLFEQQQKQ